MIAKESDQKVAKTKNSDLKFKREEMLKAGLQFGHRTSRAHPKMRQFLQGVRNTVHIIDIEKTAEKLKQTLAFIQELISDNKVILFVGTKVQVKDLVEEVASACKMPYVTDRWLGGTFTNFEIIKKRIEYFKDLQKKKEDGELEKYTKKEKAKIEREIAGLAKRFEGMRDLTKFPDAIFVIDMKKDALAIKEARQKNIKVIAIADTDVDPDLADCFIPANDDAISSITYILEKVKEVILNTKPKVAAKEEKEEEEKDK